MRVDCVTICIHQSNVLKRTLVNREQFDRWLVVTADDDPDTVHVCEAANVRCLVADPSRGALGKFDPAFNKASYINIGLDALRSPEWVLVLDCDILLPRIFRSYVSRIQLDTGCLYGVIGRCQCESPSSFNGIRPFEPWRFSMETTISPLGYFHMFSSEKDLRRYPASDPKREQHDDIRFANTFSADRWRKLPLTCLHLGSTYVSWRRRSLGLSALDAVDQQPTRSLQFAASTTYLASESNPLSSPEVPADDYLVRLLQQHAKAKRRRLQLLLIGEPSPEAVSGLRSSCDLVCWVRDPCAVAGGRLKTANVVFEAGPELLELPCCERSPESVAEGLITKELDAVFVAREFTDEDWMDWIPLLEKRLSPDGVLCGGLYGWADFPHSTASLVRFVGSPRHVGDRGAWMTSSVLRVRSPSAEAGNAAGSRRGIAYYLCSNPDWAALCTSLSALRERWTGNVSLLVCNPRSPELWRIRNSYALDHIEMPPFPQTLPNLLALTPFEVTLFLAENQVLCGDLDQLFKSIEEGFLVIPEFRVKTSPRHSAGWKAAAERGNSPSATSTWFGLRKTQRALDVLYQVSCQDERVGLVEYPRLLQQASQHLPTLRMEQNPFAQFSPALAGGRLASRCLQQLELATIGWLTPEVPCGKAFSVVACVSSSSVALFLRNRLSWRLACPVIIVADQRTCDTIAQEELPTGYTAPVLVVAQNGHRATCPIQTALVSALPLVSTTHIVCLDPRLVAVPGAQLFAHERWQHFDYIGSGYFFQHSSNDDFCVERACRVRYPHATFNVEMARAIVAGVHHPMLPGPFERFASQILLKKNSRSVAVDLRPWGWQMSSIDDT